MDNSNCLFAFKMKKNLSQKQVNLIAWIKQKWRTKSGKKSSLTKERYLPEKAIKALKKVIISLPQI